MNSSEFTCFPICQMIYSFFTNVTFLLNGKKGGRTERKKERKQERKQEERDKNKS